MDLTSFLLGSLVTVVLGIIANLLTPTMKPLWAMFRSVQQRGEDNCPNPGTRDDTRF
jgi:hypothetical protein